MFMSLRRRAPREPDLPGVRGTVRIDVRTKHLTKRLRSGDIAVIDHQDIDKVSAEALLACKPVAVINAASSITGRYPNLGPQILVDAGIPLVDSVGKDVMLELRDGQNVRLDGDTLYVGDVVVAKGTLFDKDIVDVAMTEARAGLAVQLEAFAANTMEYLRRERELLLDGVGVPDITTILDGRRPGDPAALHPRVSTHPDRGRRWRRCAARGRSPSAPHRRRHGLGLGRNLAVRG
jgi:uncharacterized membrane-anchored protein